MSGHRIAAITRRLLQGFRRDRRTLALLFVAPIVILGLLGYLEDVIDSPLELGNLPSLARDWEDRISTVVDEDPNLAAYIAELEDLADEAESGTGDALAAEFERYLRRIG